jgi:hypothetical protein
VEWLDGPGVGAIEHLAAIAANVNEAYFEQNAEVLGDGWLRQIEGGDDVVYGALLGYEEAENVAAAGFGHGVEGVGGGGGARHGRIIFPYRHMSSVIFLPETPRLFLQARVLNRQPHPGGVKTPHLHAAQMRGDW